jgi:Sulfotransferase family
MPSPKEPSYLCWEGTETHKPGRNAITNFDDYAALFEGATQKAIGEASVIYLYLADFTVGRIRGVLGGPKLLAILRNPIERAFSQYRMASREGAETLPTFAEALAAEDDRVQAGLRPVVHYRRQSLYADKLQRFIDEFGRDQITVVTFDDFTAEPDRVLREVFTFLDVDPDFKVDTSKAHNVTSPQPVGMRQKLKALRQRLRGKTRSERPDRRERRLRLETAEKTLSPDIRAELTEYFRSDVQATAEILGRDLSHWLGPSA